jgi:hypothetical protein
MEVQQHIAPEQRRQLEELYRQQISAVRTLARLLGYPCPIASREERRAASVQPIDDRAILGTVAEQGLR